MESHMEAWNKRSGLWRSRNGVVQQRLDGLGWKSDSGDSALEEVLRIWGLVMELPDGLVVELPHSRRSHGEDNVLQRDVCREHQ